MLSLAAPAHADTSAWVSANGGTAIYTMDDSDVVVRGMMAFDAGVGSSPTAPFLVGGIFRLAPILPEGVDVFFLARGATGGFQVGDFGVAVDLGGYIRSFGPSSPSGGFAGSVLLGAPLGFQLTLTGQVGTASTYGGSATLGIDLLRLTVYRQSLTDWWPNPSSPGDASRALAHE
ncbi:MAG TPA: hypothetical protein VL400_27110 [Polyangiaceae bacterium]|nr:hypothetical protein [Polyangiaceae bacterium]